VVARGTLRIYLGAAPGVGKTYAMLAEGQRRRSRETDVVMALVETHGRRLTADMAEGLELIPRRTLSYRGATFTEMDVDAVLARHPRVALVDELAHTNVPGCRNPKRWQDVDEMLDAGINVVSTLNIQHLESLNGVVKQITGVAQQETLPDEIARRADQIELVDITPEALRRRMVHGNVYPPDRIEAALTHYFRPGNLTALRELALLWVADRVEEGLQRYRAEHGIAAPWETRERIVVGVAGEEDDEEVIRRAARIAARTPGSDLLAVHVTCDDGLAVGNAVTLDRQRALVASFGGTFQQVPGGDVAETLLRFARAEDATQMVLGASRRSRLLTLLAGKSTPTRLARKAEHIDVHLVSREFAHHDLLTSSRPLAAIRSRRVSAARASAEAAVLSRLAISVLRGHGDLPALLEETRQIFGLAAVSLLERRPAGLHSGWYIAASAGERPPEAPGADVDVPITETVAIAGRGRALSAGDARILQACACQLLAGSSPGRQDEQDAEAARQPADLRSRSRSALVTATIGAARDQLAAAHAALAGLADLDATAAPEDRTAMVAAAQRAVDHVVELVADVGDLSRLHAGAMETYLRPVEFDEIVAAALDDLGPGAQHITLSTPENLPDVVADAAFLTRILTSLMADALRRSPPGIPPVLTAARLAAHVEIRITDRGPAQQGNGTGSLALRLARDLTEAMGDTLRCEPDPSGGRIVTITLPAVARRESAAPAGEPAVAVPAASSLSPPSEG
jgi:two-component system, OmpR family, sensor histidine kinase KdpD